MNTTRAACRRAFSIIELLTVVFIIGLLIAILVPTLSGVQKAGRKASTQSLLVGLNQAAASFELDNRRQPGYFAMSELGSETNFNGGSVTGEGLNALENALLDLSGIGAVDTVDPSSNNWVEVNPTDDDDNAIWVKADLIGSDEGNYFMPGGGSLVHMTRDQQPGDITAAPGPPQPGLPDLVDSFGQPILAWIVDSGVSSHITEQHDLASLSIDDHPSNFYWASNGSMLSSESLGEQGRNMSQSPSTSGGSLIGKGAYDVSEAAIEGVMGALLGHPGYPDEATLRGSNAYDDVFPKQARGGFVAHSAGPDGVYLAADDSKAGRVIAGDMLGGGSLNVTYGVNFFLDTSGTRRTGDNGQPITSDFLDGFDDIVVAQ